MSDVKTAVRAGPPADPAADPLDAWVTRGAEPGVAPGVTERLRALLNTDDRFHGVDRLRGQGPSALVQVRDALRHYLVTGDGTALGAIAAEHPLVVDPRADGLRLVPAPGSGADAALVAGVLASLHEAVGSGDWGRLKACANPDCRWIYHDASRNRSGRWCSMGECGDVMKARAYRRRGRAGAERAGTERAGAERAGAERAGAQPTG